MQTSKRRFKLATILFFSLLLSFALRVQPSGAATVTQEPRRMEIIGMGATMSERLGADDNPALVVHFAGDIHGSLETCG